ncbi:MAG: alpha-glucosidase [Verrucomicrobia bacterium]|nr:alpha-glucosidase [Verrucomicrobiota bacterium]
MKSEWWRGAIIYQIYPRSFFDSNEDGTGDLIGITQKLDYISDLGVDAIWISPFFKSPMRDFGYDVGDYRMVDPIFGTNSDFNSLLLAAHEKGLKVIIDMVMGHTSDQHLWFQESSENLTNPKANWYVWADAKADGTPPNNWLSVFGGSAWQWDARRKQYYLHHYLRSQPNLNWHDQEVVDAMFGEVRFWLDAGVDGLRLDAITTLTHDPELRDNPPLNPDPTDTKLLPVAKNPFNWQRLVYTRDQARTLELLGELRELINQYDNRYLIGEVADVEMISVSAKYTRTGEHLHSCYNFELMQRPLTVPSLSEVIAKTEAVLLGGWTTWAMSNHDNQRVVTRAERRSELQGDERALAKLLLAALLSFRGGACVYQGEELGLPEAEIAFEDLQDPFGIEFWPEFKGRDGCRTPMPWSSGLPNGGFSVAKPWLPVPREHLALAAEDQEKDPQSVLQMFRRFSAWRKQHAALVTGDLALVQANEPVLAFERRGNGERILCLFNFSNQDVVQLVSGRWQPLDGHGFDPVRFEQDTASLPAFGVWFGVPLSAA